MSRGSTGCVGVIARTGVTLLLRRGGARGAVGLLAVGLVTPAVEPPASSAWCHTDCSHPLLMSSSEAALLDLTRESSLTARTDD